MEITVKNLKMFNGQSFLVNSDLKSPQKSPGMRNKSEENATDQEFYPKSKQLHKQ